MLEPLNKVTLTLGQALDALTRFMVDAAKALEELVGQFFKALLQFLDDAQLWVHETFERIRDYLTHFLPALAYFAFALVKLSLFYLPTFACLVAYFALYPSIIWVLFGLLWFIFITGIGLTYGKRQHKPTLQDSTEGSTGDYQELHIFSDKL